MTPALRKLNLTVHLITSIGWLGAVAGFLVLSIAGLASRDADTVRGAYLAMNLIGQFVIVPLSLAALLTGLVQSLGTEWGLFRYYWVVAKFALTMGAVILLFLHQFTAVAGAARRASAAPPGTRPDVGQLGIQLVGDAALAVVLLLAITALGVYKPWGRTPYGLRLPDLPHNEASMPSGLKVFLVIIGLIMALFLVVHLAGGGLGHHGHGG